MGFGSVASVEKQGQRQLLAAMAELQRSSEAISELSYKRAPVRSHMLCQHFLLDY